MLKKKIYYRKKIKIEIVTNKRKNQLIQNNDKETQLYEKRYLLVNCFILLKNTFTSGKVYIYPLSLNIFLDDSLVLK